MCVVCLEFCAAMREFEFGLELELEWHDDDAVEAALKAPRWSESALVAGGSRVVRAAGLAPAPLVEV